MTNHLGCCRCMSQRLCAWMAMMLILLAMFLVDPSSAKISRCTKQERVVDVGVVVDANSKSGKMMMAAIEVACSELESKYKLELKPIYVNSNGHPGRALSLAEELIGREEVRLIVWLDVWREESLLSGISRRSRILIVSFDNREGSRLGTREHGDELEEFRRKFAKRFRRMYATGRHRDFDLSINTLRAYDCIKAIARSFDRDRCEISTSKMSESEFTGLSGPIDVRKSVGLRLWSPEGEGDARKGTRSRVLEEGAVVAAATKKLSIGVPRKTPFDLFVREEVDEKTGKTKYVGFCIDVFLAALDRVDIRGLAYDFVPHNGTYDELVEKVHNQTYDGAVGDITILSRRSREVEFTQPFMESSLSMIVPARHRGKSFLFAKPFTPVMWAVSGGVLLYTVFIVWALEHGHNKEFSGPPTQQISTAMWFTFSSIFFAHREQIRNTLSRIVLVIWFFVALILTQSYTASLTSMLTVQNIEPSITTIEWLKANNAPVGCDNEAFVCNYLVNVLDFDIRNIRGISDTSSYGDHFTNRSIYALFMENPYEKAFFTRFCKGYVHTPLSYRFGGFGFVFPKNSALADTFSEAILELSENGSLSRLQTDQFTPSCIANGNITASDIETPPSLGIDSFWVLYFLTIGTSTCCLVVSLIFFRKRHVYRRNQDSGIGGPPMEMNPICDDQGGATGR